MAELIPFSLGASPDALDDAVQAFFLKTQSDVETYYDKYFNVEKGVNTRVLRDSGLSGFGYAATITDNAVITAESPVETFDKSYTQREFGKLGKFTKQMWKFGIQRRDVENVVKDLVEACHRRREDDCAKAIDNMEATSYVDRDGNTISTVGGDTQAAVDNDHTREDGGTVWNNKVYDGTTYNMDFEYDALRAALRTGQLILGPKGQIMDISPNVLLCKKNSSVHFRAMEILGAIKSGKIPGSFDNDGAGVPAFEILAVPYLANDTYWGMFDKSKMDSRIGFQLKESQPIQLEGPDVVFETGEIRYKSTNMYDLGFNDARNFVGSTSANS